MADCDLIESNQEFDLFKYINDDLIMEGVSLIDENSFNYRSSTPKPDYSNLLLDPDEQQKIISEQDSLPEFDPNLIELQEIMSTSNTLDDSSNLISATLNDIPLIETNPNAQIIPVTELKLIKAPENLINSTDFENIPSLVLKKSTLKAIDRAMAKNESVMIPPLKITDYAKPVKRAPLSIVQPIIYSEDPPIKPELCSEEKNKVAHKRKQAFNFPREDGMMFISDGEPSPKKACLDTSEEQPMIDEATESAANTVAQQSRSKEVVKSAKKSQKRALTKCRVCNREFKNINMHKCKDVGKKPKMKAIKPSEIPLNEIKLKCDLCGRHFDDIDTLYAHHNEEHSQLICKTCKFVAKSRIGLCSHSKSCNKTQKLTTMLKSKKPRAVMKMQKIDIKKDN